MNRMPKVVRDFGRVLSANGLVAVTSMISVLLLPKIISTEQYALWQLFLFITSYSLFLQLGLADGAYLRYGGRTRKDLAAQGIESQALLLVGGLTGLISIGLFVVLMMSPSPDRLIVLVAALLYAIIVNLQQLLMLVLQSIGEFRAFQRISVLDRMVFISLVIVFLLLGSRTFLAIVIAEIVAKLASTIYATWDWMRLREVHPRSSVGETLREMWQNIKAGSQITIANTGNMLIIGVARFSVERVWGLLVFGGFSLALNLVSFFMVFINAAGLTLFPTLKKSSEHVHRRTLEVVLPVLSMVTAGILVFAHPIFLVLHAWLPEYGSSLEVLLLLLPIIIFESRMGLILSPLMKARRMETAVLLVNLPALATSIVLTVVFSLVIPSTQLVAASIVVSLGIRALLAEGALRNRIGLPKLNTRATLVEVVLLLTYYATTVLVGGWASAGLYLAVLAFCLFVQRRPLMLGFRAIRRRLG